MEEKIKMKDGNILIYVVEPTGIHSGISFFVLEVEEKKKTYRVVKAYEYMGKGLVRETSIHLVLQFYKKENKSVYIDFESARLSAIYRAERMVERCKEEIKRNSAKIDIWKS